VACAAEPGGIVWLLLLTLCGGSECLHLNNFGGRSHGCGSAARLAGRWEAGGFHSGPALPAERTIVT